MMPGRIYLVLSLLLLAAQSLKANGGAWQVGVPSTGNVAASDKGHSTEVALDEETLTIDLHQEFAAVEVRYRMRNTGGKILQDFFFPVERWSLESDSSSESDNPALKPPDLEGYRITADNTELKWTNIDSPEKAAPMADQNWGEFPPATKLWKKSQIPFAPKQSREVVIRYRADYSGSDGSVSDDEHRSDHLFVYSLSPAATWKGKIANGKVIVNILHPLPEEVEIARPTDRFKKVGETRYEWTFHDLEPTLDDDLKIVAHPRQDTYPVGGYGGQVQSRAEYVIEGSHYFLLHSDFDAVASSTLPAEGKKNYEVNNVKETSDDVTWAEGAAGDGIGESITLEVKRPLPLAAIMIMPGYRNAENPALWTKNNRVAELEVTLNGEHSFVARIPDEKFSDAYPLPIRDYSQPVKTIKLVIKGVHRGTAARDTCISSLRLKAKLARKPEFQPAR